MIGGVTIGENPPLATNQMVGRTMLEVKQYHRQATTVT
jgi:hypothetical protein